MTDLTTPPRRSSVVAASATTAVPQHPSEPGGSTTVTELIGRGGGATHLTISIVELAPGGTILGHLHPFEESFFILDGRPLLSIRGDAHQLEPDDFGYVPTAFEHAWSNPGDTVARWLRVHSPQPRPIAGRAPHGVYAAPELAPPTEGRSVDELDPRCHYLGHFDESDMAPPGPIAMPGYHGANIKNVQIRMMVDDLLGAVQHTMFIVQFTPQPSAKGISAREHFHPFEEIYYLLSGSATASFDGEQELARTGDLVFAPTGASHGFSPVGTEPVRWIEVQSPTPPPSHGFTFHADWERLDALD